MPQDWKDALAALRGMSAPEDAGSSESDNDAASVADSRRSGVVASGRVLKLFYEKKGRAGKPATIIEGFDPDDDAEVLGVARLLKQKLGCGGSARGGEILLQGDRRQQARILLEGEGYIVKG